MRYSALISQIKLGRHIVALEFRKILAYRVDFWSGFVGSTVSEMAVAYFVWKAVFEQRGVEVLNGFSFSGLMLYFLVAQMVNQIVQGQSMHFISAEIYDGSLTRYIVYPLSFVYYKLLSHLTFSFFAIGQLILGFILFFVSYGEPTGIALSVTNLALALVAVLVAAVLYFLMAAALEMTAFWAENVWSLMVMLRFATRLCGGGIVPTSFFPEWCQTVIKASPFYVAGALPIEVSLGRIDSAGLQAAFAWSLLWLVAFTLIVAMVWQRGRLKYTGVGI